MADTFSVTQVTNLSGLGDVDGDGVIDPGEIVTTTVTITNNSATNDATGVSFAEVLQGMTQVDQGGDSIAANDINVSPLAFDDSYNSVGNATLTVSQANGVLGSAVANVHETFAADTEFLSQSIGTGANQTHVVAGTFATAHGGSVTIAADGSFTYTPAAGFAGTGVNADSFTYTLRDAGLDGNAGNADDLTGSGTVSIDVGPVVWFIDNSAATNGNGTQASPFNSIANFNAVNNGGVGHPHTGDTVYLATGTGTYSGTDGINLLTGQTLIGAGEALTITPTGGGNPVTIFAAGTAPVIEVTGTGEGVSLAQDNTLRGFAISTTVAGADGIEDGNGTVGNLTVSNISISGTGQAVDIDQGGNLNVTITSLSSSGSSEQAVQLAATGNVLTGSFTANGGTIAGSTLAAFQVGDGAGGANTGGTVAISYSGSIAATGLVHTVDIQDRAATAGTITLSGGLSHSGSGTAIFADGNAAGIINFSGSSKVLASGTATAVDLTNNTGATINFTGGGLDIDTGAGTGFSATGGGTVTIQGSGNSINATGGTAVNLASVTVGSSGVTLASTDSGGGARGVNLDTVTGTGSISLGNGTLANHSAAEIDINAGSGNVTYNGTIGNGTGLSAEISNHTSGTISITGNINDSNDAGGGISIFGNSGGTIDFTGTTKTLNTGASNAVDLANNTGATINFTGGGLDIDTTSGKGIEATGGGTVTVTGSNNTITSTTGTALDVQNTGIGANDLTFVSIASNGAVNGIVLNNTGTSASFGGLVVTGDTGTSNNGSGGSITGSTGAGISLTNTRDVSLDQMNVTGGGGDGIHGVGVVNFTLNHSNINNNGNDTADDGLQFGEDSGSVVGVTGDVSILNTSISGNAHNGVHIRNTSGTIDNLTVTNSTFNDVNDTFGANAFLFEGSGTSTITEAFITGSTFSNNTPQRALEVQAHDTATVSDFVVSGNTFTNNGIHASFTQDGSSNLEFYFVNNGTAGTPMTGSVLQSVNVFSSSQSTGGTIVGTIQGNFIGNAAVPNSGGGAGISATIQGQTDATLLIDGNTIRQTNGDGRGIYVGVRGPANPLAGTLGANTVVSDVTITNNNVIPGNTVNNFGAAIVLEADNQTLSDAKAPTVRANITGNTVPDVATRPVNGEFFNAHIIFFEYSSAGAHGIGQLVDTAPASANPTAQLTSTNTGTAQGSAGIDLISGPINTPPPVPTPLLADGGGVQAAPPADVTPPTDVTPPAETTPPAEVTPPAQGTGENTSPLAGDEQPPVTPTPPVAPAHPVIVNDGVLSQSELDYFVDAAITRWAGAGLSAEQLAALHDMHFTVANMSGLYLGSYSPDAITVDADAAGWGWFLDGTPLEDSEFGNQLAATRMTTDPTGAPAGHYDLMTALMHEMGHALGLGDSYNAADAADLMYGWLQLGERRLAAAGEAGAAVTGSIATEEFLGSPVNIGVLPAGKSVTVQWQATIDPQEDQLIVNPVNHGTVSASNTLPAFPDTDSNTVITGVDTLTLGDRVFREVGTANGIFDGSDVGVSGVRLSLFTDDNDNGVWDAGDQAVLQLDGVTPLTATTNASGFYSFGGLAPGDYIVRVDLTNFIAGDAFDALVPYQNSSPGNPDPDNNVDNDDNGSRVLGDAAYSQTITLAYNTEPTAGTGNDTNNTLDIGFYPNQAPTITNLNGDSATFVEDGGPLLLDDSSVPELPASVADSDSTDFNTGNLTVSIAAGGVPAEDALSIVVGNLITIAGNVVSYNGNAIGTFTGGTGGASLVITFNSVNATPVAVTALIGQIAYQNTNTLTPNAGDRTVNFTVNDGDGGTSTASAVTLHITTVNDEPTLVATAVNPTFTEGGAAADIFTTPIVGSTVEAGQTFTSMTLTVTNVTDGASEILNFDGTNVALTNGNSVGPTATNGLTVTVGVIGTTATVTFGGAGLTAGQLQTLVNALSYSNTSQDPTDANRVVTITQLVDSGSSSAPNDNTAALSIVSTVNVDPVNDEPTLTATAVNPIFTEGGGVADIFSGVTASTVEAGQSFTSMTLTVTNVTDIGSEILTLDGSDVTLSNGFAVTTATNGLSVTVSFVGNTASVTFGGTLNPAQLQTLVDDLSYRNSSQNPTDANRVVTITQLVDSGSNAAPNDNIATLTVVSTVNVNPTNDAPDATITPPSYLGQPNVALNLKNNGLAVADIDGNAGSETVTLSVTSGTLNVTAGGSGAGVLGSGTSSVTITGTIAQINALLNTDPTSTVSFIDGTGGSKTLTLLVHDNGNTGGGDLSASDTAQIVLDNPPVANATTGSGTEDQGARIAINLSATDADSGDVIGHFTIATLAAHGQLFAASSGGLALGAGDTIDAVGSGPYTGVVYFVPDADWNSGAGTDSFTYTANDGIIDGAPATATITVSAVSDPLTTAAPPTATVAEDTPTAISGLSIADVDATLAPAGVYEVTLASTHGTLTLATLAGLTFTAGDGTGDGSMTFHGTLASINTALATASYAPDADYNGDAEISIAATDQFGGIVATGSGVASSDGDTIAFIVTAVSDPVSAIVPAPAAGDEDTAIAISGMSIADVDATLAPNGIYEVTLGATNGTLTLSTIAGLTFTGGDGTGDATMTFHGTLAAINTALATASYTGNPDFNGAAQVTLAVTDTFGGIVATGTGAASSDSDIVTVTVNAANDPVTSSAPATATAAEDGGAAAISGLSISDVDTALAPAGIYEVTLAATNGTLTLGAGTLGALSFTSGDGTADASMTFSGTLADINTALATAGYTGATNFNGSATVSIFVTDNVGGVIATGTGAATSDSDIVNVTVTAANDPVTSSAPATATGDEDTAIAISGMLIADVDATLAPNGIYEVTLGATNGALTLSTIAGLTFTGGDGTGDATMTFHGTLAAINTALATASYTGDPDFNGSATVAIAVTDTFGGIVATGTGAATSDSDSVTVTVNAVNDPVTSNAPATATVSEETLTAVSGLSISDVDTLLAPGGIYEVTLAATNGTLTLGAGTLGALSFTSGDGTADASMTFSGTLADINTALATAGYTGATNFNGSATVSIFVTDNVGGIIATGTGAATSDSDTVNVTVTAANDPVTSNAPPTATGDEDTAIAISGMSIADVDATLAPNGIYEVTLGATNGTLTLSTIAGLTFTGGDGTGDATMTFHGTLAAINTALATASYTGDPDFNGSATVAIAVTDTFGGIVATGTGAATSDSDSVTVTVNAVNDPVTSNAPATATVGEETLTAVSGLSISDVDTLLAPGGIYEVTLAATNGTLTLGAGTLAALSFTSGDGTADASMTFSGTLADINTALATAGYTGATNFNGSATVSIFVTDNVGGIIATGTGAATSDSDTVNVTVTAANDPVTSNAPPTATGNEDAAIAIAGLSIADVDATLAPGGIYSVTLAANNGTLSLATLAGLTFSGGSDGTADATMTFTGTLANINAALATASYTGALNFNGAAQVSIAVTDTVGGIVATGTGAATSDSDIVAVTVNAVNDAPVNSGPATASTTENISLVFSSGNSNLISVGDVDVNAGDLDVTLTVTHGTISLSQTTGLAFSVGSGTNETTMSFSGTVTEINAALAGLTYAPTPGYSGPASLQIVTDDNGQTGSGGTGTDTDTVAITVNPINHAPSGSDATITAFEDTARVLTAADFGFSDAVDGNTLAAVKISTLPGAGTLKNNGVAVTAGQTISIADINAGHLSFQAALNANGAAYAAFNFQVQDNGGTAGGGVDLDQTPNTLTVDVNAVNDAPSAVVLSNVHGPFPENTRTALPIKVANIAVTDVDGGTNILSLSGADANLFRLIGSTLWLKAGAHLDYETNPFLNVNVNVNDPTVGGPIDATKALAIAVTDIAENITGTPHNDRLIGTKNGETIIGLAGNDIIYGNAGNDRIIGGPGADFMIGGPGKDVFVFNSIQDSAPGQSGYINNQTFNWLSGVGRRDIIADFTHGQDKIDLSAIDANNHAGGNQAFTWIGLGNFHNHHPGELGYRQYNFSGTAHDKTIIYGDINGDARADFQIELTGLKALVPSDFIL